MNDYVDYLTVPPRPDDHEIVVGNRGFAEVATAEGFPMSTPTMQRYTAPSVNEGPKILGYFGRKPTTTKGLIRQWCRDRVRRTHHVDDRPLEAHPK